MIQKETEDWRNPQLCVSQYMGESSARGYVCLGEDRDKKVMSPRARLRSALQAKLLALEIKSLPKDANANVLIANVLIADPPKVERNRNPTKNQLSIECPSYGLSSCTETFCVAKKWRDIRPKKNEGTSNLV